MYFLPKHFSLGNLIRKMRAQPYVFARFKTQVLEAFYIMHINRRLSNIIKVYKYES